MTLLNQDTLKGVLIYTPDTGEFTWRPAVCNIKKANSLAGYKATNGYTCIAYKSTYYYAHRLAWVYVYGAIPEGATIDHINGNKSDNRLENLRLATRAEQSQNTSLYKGNTSGYTGVTWHKKDKKWMAQIRVDGKSIYLGEYTSIEAANEAYKQAKQQYHIFNPIQRCSALAIDDN